MGREERPPPTAPTDLGIVCTCSADDPRAAQARTQHVRGLLPTSRAPLLTAICGSLLMDHHVAQIQIYADQWFAITAVCRDGPPFRGRLR